MDIGLLNPFELDKSTLPVLEDILDAENKKLQELNALKDKRHLKFGKVLSRDSLEHMLFPEVCSKVNQFLGVSEITPPSLQCYRYFPQTAMPYLAGRYALTGLMLSETVVFSPFLPSWVLLPLLGSVGLLLFATLRSHQIKIQSGDKYLLTSDNSLIIQIRRNSKASIFGTLCHEYTHHVYGLKHPDTYLLPARNLSAEILTEGHARGVARKMSSNCFVEENNPAFLYFDQQFLVGEFKSIYKWRCKEMGLTPKKNLTGVKTFIDAVENEARHVMGIPTPHALGNLIFYSIEKSCGYGIYKSFLHSIPAPKNR